MRIPSSKNIKLNFDFENRLCFKWSYKASKNLKKLMFRCRNKLNFTYPIRKFHNCSHTTEQYETFEDDDGNVWNV